MSVSVYAFVNANGQVVNAAQTKFNFVGTWSSTGTYATATLDTVAYGNGNYTCIVDNIGYNPSAPVTRTRPQKWSNLVVMFNGTVPATASSAQSTADSTARVESSNFSTAQSNNFSQSALISIAQSTADAGGGGGGCGPGR